MIEFAQSNKSRKQNSIQLKLQISYDSDLHAGIPQRVRHSHETKVQFLVPLLPLSQNQMRHGIVRERSENIEETR